MTLRRYILERASARESAARVAAGAMAKMLLMTFGIEVWSHAVAVGAVRLKREVSWDEIKAAALQGPALLRCADAETEIAMKAEVDQAYKTGDTVGGVFEVVARGVPVGLGTHTNWDERLDGLLAQAVMSLQAVKAVEIGDGMENAISFGSTVQDPIGYSKGEQRFTRQRNRAGGIEGGISNGQDIVVRGFLKPISTLRRPLESADLVTKEKVEAAYERSDVCVVPAGGVAAESMVALVIARCFLEKFGGDSVGEISRNFDGYLAQVKNSSRVRILSRIPPYTSERTMSFAKKSVGNPISIALASSSVFTCSGAERQIETREIILQLRKLARTDDGNHRYGTIAKPRGRHLRHAASSFVRHFLHSGDDPLGSLLLRHEAFHHLALHARRFCAISGRRMAVILACEYAVR